MRGHAWCQAVFRVSNAKISRGNTDFHEMKRGIATRWNVALPWDETWYLHQTWHVAFTRDRIVIFTRDVVVLTKLNNRQDSSCL